MAIHWRTAAIAPNITALAQAGWDFDRAPATPSAPPPATMPGMDAFWADWGRGMFGGDAGAEAGRLIQKFDGGHLAINALIHGGAETTDAHIAAFFAPLREMESLRPRIQGAGNLERFDYWLNLIRATHLRVRTWVLADRLGREDRTKPTRFRRLTGSGISSASEVLPLRLDLARSYEDMIAAFVRCAKSPGEIGTITSIESGCRERIVSAHDAAIAQILGQPLPAEAAVSTAYRGDAADFRLGQRAPK